MLPEIFVEVAAGIIIVFVEDILGRPRFRRIRDRLKNYDIVKLELAKVLDESYSTFCEKYPELVASFLDEHYFRKSAVQAELAKLLLVGRSPSIPSLQRIWQLQFSSMERDISTELNDLVTIIDEQLDEHPHLYNLRNSRNLGDITHVIRQVPSHVETFITLFQKYITVQQERNSLMRDQKNELKSQTKYLKTLTKQQKELLELMRKQLLLEERTQSIDITVVNLSLSDADLLEHRIAEILSESRKNVKLEDRKRGSLIGKLKLPPEQISRLLELFETSPDLFEGLQISNLRKAVGDLREVDLSNIEITDYDLSGVDLTRANLRGCVIDEVNFSSANLSHARLDRAHITSTKFVEATLVAASMNQTYLDLVDFSKANLRRVVLTGAKLERISVRQTILPNGKVTNSISDMRQFATARRPSRQRERQETESRSQPPDFQPNAAKFDKFVLKTGQLIDLAAERGIRTTPAKLNMLRNMNVIPSSLFARKRPGLMQSRWYYAPETVDWLALLERIYKLNSRVTYRLIGRIFEIASNKWSDEDALKRLEELFERSDRDYRVFVAQLRETGLELDYDILASADLPHR